MTMATSGALSIGDTAGSGITPRRSINEELGVPCLLYTSPSPRD